jgi:transcription antitermination factor NusG
MENLTQRLWFAVGVKPRHEKAVALAMDASGLEHFAPVYREQRVWTDRIKLVELPLFPGYVFCRFRYAERLDVLNVAGVTSILGGGKMFAPISDEQIDALRTIAASKTAARPWPYLTPGQIVQVQRGPLAGIKGTIVRVKGIACIVISVEILQRSVAVEVDTDAVRPVEPLVQTHIAAACAGHELF